MDVTSGTRGHADVSSTPEFMRVNTAAKRLGLSRREVYRLIETGELASHPYGRIKLIDETAVTELAKRIRNGELAAAKAAVA